MGPGTRRAGWAVVVMALVGLVYELSPDRRANVVMITVDSLRPDRLGCYGYGESRTPNMDWLAAEGVLFENAVCDVPWTTAAVASVLTGRYAVHHGLRSPYQQLADREVTLAEVLARRGYQTAAVVGSFPVDHVFNLAQGFTVYDDRYQLPMVERGARRPRLRSAFFANVEANRAFRAKKLEADSYRPDEMVADAAIGWLRRASRVRPFFLWIHFFGPHGTRRPAAPPGENITRRLRSYDASVESVDQQVGRVLAEISRAGLRQRTLIALHGDHGKSLMEHGYVGNGTKVYDPSLRVPLIFSFPGRVRGGGRRAGLARSVDIMPTVLAILGIPLPAGLDGQSLLPVIDGDEKVAPVEAYCETLLGATSLHARRLQEAGGGTLRVGVRRQCLRTARWKYIRSAAHPVIDASPPDPIPAAVAARFAREELYDLVQDPGETRDLAGQWPAVRRRLRRRLATLGSAAAGSGAGSNGERAPEY